MPKLYVVQERPLEDITFVIASSGLSIVLHFFNEKITQRDITRN